MKYDPQKHHRRSIRLKGYDYTSPGAYFITICTHQRHCLFGEIINGEMRLNAMGQCVDAHWNRLLNHFPHLQLDGFVVMATSGSDSIQSQPESISPDLEHSTDTFCPNATSGGSIALPLKSEPGVTFGREMGADGVGNLPNVAPLRAGSLGAIVLNFKSVTTRRINRMRKMTSVPVWQRNYYERIIRDDQALERIRVYIHNNPRSWHEDRRG